MAAQFRTVEIAAGHTRRVRRSREQSSRPGFVRVENSHCGRFEITEHAWNEGTPHA